MNGKRAVDEEAGEQPRKRSRFDRPAGSTDPSASIETQQSQQNGVAAKPLPTLSALENAKKALLKRKELAAKMEAMKVLIFCTFAHG